MLTANTKGMFLMTQAVLPRMIEAHCGKIVNLASTAGTASIVTANAHYTASKGAIVAFTRRMARDFARHGINVNCVAPGLIHNTGFNEKMNPERLAYYVAQSPWAAPAMSATSPALSPSFAPRRPTSSPARSSSSTEGRPVNVPTEPLPALHQTTTGMNLPNDPFDRARDRLTIFKQTLAGREPVFGLVMQSTMIASAEIVALAGYDFAWLDMEHTAMTFRDVEHLVIALENYGCVPLVRVAANEPNCIGQALDLGVRVVNVPHVDSVEDACRAVRAQVRPVGPPRLCHVSRSTGQGTQRLDAAAMRQKNEETMLMVQIESREGVRNVAEIAAVEGINLLFVGQADLGQDLGVPPDHPKLHEALAAVGRAIRAAGKNGGLIVSDPSKLAACRQLGFDLICCGLDTMIFRNAAESLLARFRDSGTVPVLASAEMRRSPSASDRGRDEDLSRLRSQRPAARHSQRRAGRFRRPLLQSLVEGDRRPARRLHALTHKHGVGNFAPDRALFRRLIAGVTTHPNVAAVVFVSSGNEDHPPEEVLADADRAGVPCRIVSIKDCKDGGALIRRGRRLAERLVNQARRARRVAIGIDQLKIGLNCAGTDAASARSSNLVCGRAVDLLTATGATVLLSETPDLIGVEKELFERCGNSPRPEKPGTTLRLS